MYYAQIIERIWKNYPPANPTVRTDQHLVSLGVDMNDVWIVASAWERGLTLLTSDKMTCIRRVVPEVEMECWTQGNQS
jgi:predicted nucleic acid-binding protein